MYSSIVLTIITFALISNKNLVLFFYKSLFYKTYMLKIHVSAIHLIDRSNSKNFPLVINLIICKVQSATTVVQMFPNN